MEKNQVYKNRALASLEGKWTNGVVASIIVLLISGGVGTVFDISIINGIGTAWSIILLPLMWGFAVYFLNLIRNEDIRYARLFDGFKDYVRIFVALFLVALCAFVGALILFIPGIIVALMFSQTSFIMKDDKEISAVDAMKKSRAMMDGHKMELFWLSLSFIGWIILCFLTLGIGFIFLFPYTYSTYAHYYEDLKAESNQNPQII